MPCRKCSSISVLYLFPIWINILDEQQVGTNSSVCYEKSEAIKIIPGLEKCTCPLVRMSRSSHRTSTNFQSCKVFYNFYHPFCRQDEWIFWNFSSPALLLLLILTRNLVKRFPYHFIHFLNCTIMFWNNHRNDQRRIMGQGGLKLL